MARLPQKTEYVVLVAPLVLAVGLQVVREVPDPLREDRYLHLGRTGVGIMGPVLTDDLLLPLFRDAHGSRFPFSVPPHPVPVAATPRGTEWRENVRPE